MIKIKNLKGFLFVFFIIILHTSCPDPDPSYVNIYPSDIDIPGTGVLKYTKTLWDGKNEGTEIFSAAKVGDEIWIFTRDYSGFYINRGLNKSNANRLRLDSGYSYWDFGQRLITKGDYVLLLASKHTYEPKNEYIYYTTRIHKNFSNRQYFKILNTGDYDFYPDIQVYYGNGDVFFILYGDDEETDLYKPKIYYLLNDASNAVNETTEETFDNFRFQYQNIVMSEGSEGDGRYHQYDLVTDENGRFYRIYYGYDDYGFEVSIDNGTTWYKGDIGTNYPKSIVIQNGSIYVFCDAESIWGSMWSTKSVGGGIHVFQWE